MFPLEEVAELITPVAPDSVKRADGWVFDLCFRAGRLQLDDKPLLLANDKIKVISEPETRSPFAHVIRVEVLSNPITIKDGER